MLSLLKSKIKIILHTEKNKQRFSTITCPFVILSFYEIPFIKEQEDDKRMKFRGMEREIERAMREKSK